MALVVLLALAAAASSVEAFRLNPHSATRLRAAAAALHAKNSKKKKQDPDANDWYEDPSSTSAEEVFWTEMERRLRNQAGVSGSNEPSPIDMVSMIGSTAASSEDSDASLASAMAAQSAASSSQTTGGDESSYQNPIADKTSTEATLASYAPFAVPDNFLYDDEEEEMSQMMPQNDMSLWEGEEPTLDEERAELDRQLDELERELMGDGIDGSVVGGASPYFDPQISDEPWDRYGDSKTVDSDDQTTAFHKELERRIKLVSGGAKELTLDYDDDHPEEAEQEAEEDEAEYVKSLASIGMHSPRLDNAAVNPKAEAYFRREPDQLQGFDTMWVSSIDTPCTENLFGIFSNYGVQFADNFDDWQEEDDDQFRPIEDIASYKARKVFQVTGLPCIASRTSFEIEPIRPEDMEKPVGTTDKPATAKKMKQNQSAKSPRVVSGYAFNNIGQHVDHMIQALLPYSEPTRKTRFRSVVCYYDGEMELFEFGELDCDIYFSGSMRTFIPMSSAINSMLKSLELALDLTYQSWLYSKANDSTAGGIYSEASIKLRDRILKEGRVLPNDIVDVSSFMDAFVDVNLMDECAKHLAERFSKTKPSKILTIATTGLVVAIPMAKYLQVPLVYARKQRSVVMKDTFDAVYNSKTSGKDRQLLVSKDHIDEDDRVLIVDDFLSSGASQEALLRIVSEAGATPVGVGVLLEKGYDAGRVSLSGFGIPVEAVVRIASVEEGVIRVYEEEGFEKDASELNQR